MKAVTLLMLACLLAGCVNLHVHFPPADATGETPTASKP